MSLTKHKIFKISLSDDGKFTVNQTVEKTINEFLADSNNVYVNHSITVLTEDINVFDNLKTICRHVLISIVYKDLTASSLDLTIASKKVKAIVHKQIESGNEVPEPELETEFDLEVKKLGSGKISKYFGIVELE